jgi:predicted dienelactone hydrolase
LCFNINMKKLLVNILLLLWTTSYAFSQQSGNIGERTIKLYDESRKRPLVTEFWYPTNDTLKKSDRHFSPFLRKYTVQDAALPTGRFPLILLSHGTGGGRTTMEWFAQGLVNAGFIVAAVDHWGNTRDNKIPLQFFEFWQRPIDISFMLTSLLRDNKLKQVIDTAKIGAAGYSIGGYTVIGLAGAVVDFPPMITYYKTIGHREIEFPEFPGLNRMLDDSTLLADSKHIPNLKDSRIKAIFAICPGVGPGFTKREQVSNITAPVYIIGAAGDQMAPVVQNSRHYHQLIRNSVYYEFPGKTGHYVMLSEAINEVKKTDPGYFTDDISVDRHQVHLIVDSLAADFFHKQLK